MAGRTMPDTSAVRRAVRLGDLYTHQGRISKIAGVTVEATGITCNIGDICRISIGEDHDTFAEVAGMTIPEIFAAEGEEGFRAREQAYLESLAARDAAIVSCGGGVIVNDRSRELVCGLGTVVYLHVEAREAISRISHPETRPLLNGERSPAELLEERLPLYREAADIMYDTSGKNPGIVSRELGRMLEEKGLLWQ